MTGGPGPDGARPGRGPARADPAGQHRPVAPARPQILIAASATVLGLAMIGLKVFVLTHLH